MTGYCFDTDILSATIRPAPPLHLVRRLATVAPQEQFTTSITVGELIYGAQRVGRHGTPLAEPDLRIASIALARGLILVTRNVRHFQRVPELAVENWIDGT